MAEQSQDGQEKTETPTDERREQFRERGDIAHSREITSVFVLIGAITYLGFTITDSTEQMLRVLKTGLQKMSSYRPEPVNILGYFKDVWISFVSMILPIAAVSMTISMFVTFSQTRMNYSWKRLAPKWERMNPLSGLKRMVSLQALTELLKSLGKMISVSVILLLILYSEWEKVPALLNVGIVSSWKFWGKISVLFFGAVAALLLLIAAGDYLYNYFSLENKMKMTKQEVRDEFRQREIDPQVKMRLRRLQRDLTQRRNIESTKNATVLITNPTHYSVALKYEPGMVAPVLVAKGMDLLALRMREAAKESGVPIVEDKPVARALYKTTEIGDEIPQALYKAVSEVIRYVYKVKGIRLPGSQKTTMSNQ